MSALAALLAGVLDFPADDTPRLVYADALEETGEEGNVDRAELVRLQIADEGRRRQREILGRWVTEWLPPEVTAFAGDKPPGYLADDTWACGSGVEVRWSRGFVSSVKVTDSFSVLGVEELIAHFAHLYAAAIAGLFTANPLEEIALDYGAGEAYRVHRPAADWWTCVGVAAGAERLLYAGVDRAAFGQELTAKLQARLLHLGTHVLHVQRGHRDPHDIRVEDFGFVFRDDDDSNPEREP